MILPEPFLSRAKLQGADLRGANLEGIDLKSLDIKGVRLDREQAVLFVRSYGAKVDIELNIHSMKPPLRRLF